MDRLPKKFAQPIHPSTDTPLPPPFEFAVTSKPEPEPETRVYRRNPGLETLAVSLKLQLLSARRRSGGRP